MESLNNIPSAMYARLKKSCKENQYLLHSQHLLQTQFSTNHYLSSKNSSSLSSLKIGLTSTRSWLSLLLQLVQQHKFVHGKLTAAQLQWFVAHSDFLELQETNSRMESGTGFKYLHWTAKDPSMSVHSCSRRWGRWRWLSSAFFHFWHW